MMSLEYHYREIIIRLKFILLLVLLFCGLETFTVQAESPRVLIINSYHSGYKFSDNETAGVIEALRKAYPEIEPFIEYLDCKNFSDMAHFEELKKLFLAKYSGVKLSIIITMDDPALLFIKKYRDEVFGLVPVVFCGVNNFKDEMIKDMKLITGVIESMDIRENFELMLRHFPETKEIILINDYTLTGQVIHQEFLEKTSDFKSNVKFTFWPDLGIKEMLKKLNNLGPHTLVFVLAYNRDKDGVFFNFKNIVELIKKNTTVPVYGAREEGLGYGIIGGCIIGGNEHALFSANKAVDILKGKPIDSIPVFKGSTSKYMFDFNQLKNYSILIENLPPGSLIINKPLTFYGRYFLYIWGLIALFLFLLAVIIIMGINITRRRIAEAALKKAEQGLQFALQLTDSSVFEDNFVTGEVIISPAAFLKIGYSIDEIPKNTEQLLKLTHPEDLNEVLLAIDRHAKGLAEMFYSEYRLKAKDGSWVWHYGSGKITEFDSEGKPLRLVGLSQNITERKMAQQKIVEYADELKELNASKDKFFSIIAHDLKSPFLGLLGFSNLLSKNLDELSKEEIHKYANYINKSTRSVYELIEQLLAWSRLQTGRIEFSPKLINLKEICENTINVLSGNSRGKNIDLINDIAADISVKADENMLRSILHNLISNAIKFTDKGGMVKINATKLNETISITISDTGLGIKKTDIERLFRLDEHITTKGTGGEEGTGLGLVLCKEMIAKHNGNIFVESEIGKGSKFTFTLPAA